MSDVAPPVQEAGDLDTADKKQVQQPITQEKKGFRQRWPAWAKQLPRLNFTSAPKQDFQLIDLAKLNAFLQETNASPTTSQRIYDDMKHLDHELLRLFRERDYEASYHQNRYRLFQLMYIILATVATIIGAFLALMLESNPDVVPVLGLLETIIALFTTYIATISGRQPPLPLWLENRRKAEGLRREYFRYLMNVPPYDGLDTVRRRLLLSSRAARINDEGISEE